jgi:transposase
VLNGILWQVRTGAPWRDMPERYGPWKTAHERLRRWTADGTWDRILEHVVVKDDAIGRVEWVFSVDSSVVRAHQHAAGARKKGDARPTGSRPSRSTVKGSDDRGAG